MREQAARRQDDATEGERLTSLYAALSQVNQAVLRTLTRDELFTRICEVLVNVGHFRAAWIGWYDPARRQLDPVAHFGSGTESLPSRNAGCDDRAANRGPSATAFSEDRPYIGNDLLGDPSTQVSRDEILRRGVRSCAVFPIRVMGRPRGTLGVYAGTVDYFRDKEVALLADASANISFALDNFVRDEERRATDLRNVHLNRVYAVLSETNKAIVHEADPQALLAAACRILVDKGGFRMAWIGMVDEARQRVIPVASSGVVEGYLDQLAIDLTDPARNTGPTGRALILGEHAVSNDIEHDPLMSVWRDEAVRRRYFAKAAFPIRKHGVIVGAFNMYATEPGFFDDEELRLLDGLATDLGFALQNHDRELERQRMERSLRESDTRLRESLEQLHTVSIRLNQIKEQERARIARDIHDHFGQALTALKMDLTEIRRRIKAGDFNAVEERLTEMSLLIDESIDDVRRVAAQLGPVLLDDLGLVDAMQAYLDDVSRRTGVKCIFSTNVSAVEIANDRAVTLFRILQEAVTNVARHADARRVEVSLHGPPELLTLIVHDDGRGIPPVTERNPGALGLVGMRDRALLLGGDVSVTGGPGVGTTVKAWLPLMTTTP